MFLFLKQYRQKHDTTHQPFFCVWMHLLASVKQIHDDDSFFSSSADDGTYGFFVGNNNDRPLFFVWFLPVQFHGWWRVVLYLFELLLRFSCFAPSLVSDTDLRREYLYLTTLLCVCESLLTHSSSMSIVTVAPEILLRRSIQRIYKNAFHLVLERSTPPPWLLLSRAIDLLADLGTPKKLAKK